ncbi:hypothetical protein LEP1GSC172_0797 [Leptospira noguchii]|uniref:Uncharacterized protein n=1 Tax=Leptospira noguchii TaxID=28182 RepID=M6VG62_9LEPT|nr:hypothetical protein LEP1GSC172_0797 [Leptospira noguchii]
MKDLNFYTILISKISCCRGTTKARRLVFYSAIYTEWNELLESVKTTTKIQYLWELLHLINVSSM